MPYEYCFPFRGESIDVLNSAIKMDSKDLKPQSHLGNLLYEHQPEGPIKESEKSRQNPQILLYSTS